MAKPLLTIRGARRSYVADDAVLRGVDLDLSCGRVTVLLGPSGSGKSTLLRAIAGLERLDSGEIKSGDDIWDSPTTFRQPEHRRVGMVFQDFALFPHLTAAQNVAFGLTQMSASDRQARAMDLLKNVELEHRSNAYPHELSGGEQQRVALVRALAIEPDVVLLDEPFSGLDRRLRSDMRSETVATLRAAGIAALIVTHDAEEAMEIADDIALMFDGKIIQTGAPDQVYLEPTNILAARLMGDVRVIDAHAKNGHIDTPLGSFEAPDNVSNQAVSVMFRSDALRQDSQGVSFKVMHRRIHAGHARLTLCDQAESRWEADMPLSTTAQPGESITVSLDPRLTRVFPR